MLDMLELIKSGRAFTILALVCLALDLIIHRYPTNIICDILS